VSTTTFKAFEVRPGKDIIIERTERGAVKGRYKVLDKAPCATDPSMVHVVVRDVKANDLSSPSTWCYLREAAIEVL